MRIARIFSIGNLIALISTLSAQVTIGTTTIPKDSMIVYLAIGHSNMNGRGEKDKNIHPRCWNYRIDSDNHAWEPAVDSIHSQHLNTNCRSQYYGRGSMSFQFIKKMAEAYPCYHFGLIMNGNTKGTINCDPHSNSCEHSGGNNYYRKGGALYEELINCALEIKDKVTIAGIVAQIGYIESRECEARAYTFADDVAETVENMRSDLGLPDIPFLIGKYEETARDKTPYRDDVIEQIWSIPGILSKSEVINSDGPYYDGHHYNLEGNRLWADSATAIMVRNGWGPSCEPLTDNQPPSRPQNLTLLSHTATTVTLEWDASNDNVEVCTYTIYEGSQSIHQTGGDSTRATIENLDPETDYTFTVRAKDEAGNESQSSNSISVTTGVLNYVSVPFAVNCGGDGSGEFEGDKAWTIDSDYGYYDLPGADYPSFATCKIEPIAQTSDDEIFQRVRFRDFGYKFRIRNGAYLVSLLFAELWHSAPEDRLFGIKIQGEELPGMPFDIFTNADGRAIAHTLSHKAVVGEKMLDIQFIRSHTEAPIVSGIKIESSPVYILSYPNETVRFNHGETITITWTTDTSIINEALVDFSPDAGITWHAVNDETLRPGDASWEGCLWEIPRTVDNEELNSDKCLVRVRDYEKTFIDYSDEYFSIGNPETHARQLSFKDAVSPLITVSRHTVMIAGFSGQSRGLKIYDSRGICVYAATCSAQQPAIIDKTLLPEGVYIITITGKNSRFTNKRQFIYR
ncbi:MAG: hypothetical protein GF401_07105 [Chitinivibrionales bacterium]|nr:hypothetical protein [Chitinivibrionales bacterium]